MCIPWINVLSYKGYVEAVSSRNTNRFMVLLGKIYPLNNEGRTAALEEISTSLEDGRIFLRDLSL